MNKKKIAILFGGCSEEHDVSIKSAREIADNINLDKYETLYIGITRCGTWKMCEKPCPQWENQNCSSVLISPDRKTHGLIIFQDNSFQICHIDAVFPVLHGKMGEDGTIQGLLELAGIPYVGCGVQSSVICMDKSLAYMIVKSAGIAAPDFWVFDNGDIPKVETAAYPVFVKPARSGSSFGVVKVNQNNEMEDAVKIARQYDNKVIIERAVSGVETGCAVLGNDHELITGEVDQVSLSHGFFRIHQESRPEAGSENASITVPAKLSVEQRKQIQETAKLIYKALGCKGLARIDMFLQHDGQIVFNEANTLPGFTSYSRYPRMMAAAGITLSEVIDRCISLALEE